MKTKDAFIILWLILISLMLVFLSRNIAASAMEAPTPVSPGNQVTQIASTY